jgi:hypothetical protein
MYRVTGVIVFVTLILHVVGSIGFRWYGMGSVLPDYDAPSEEDIDGDESLNVEESLPTDEIFEHETNQA